jgi:hypothetical protein
MNTISRLYEGLVVMCSFWGEILYDHAVIFMAETVSPITWAPT